MYGYPWVRTRLISALAFRCGILKVEKKFLAVYKNFENAGANKSTTNSCHKRPNPITPFSTQPRSSKMYSAISVQDCVRQQTARLHIDQLKSVAKINISKKKSKCFVCGFIHEKCCFFM